jgi:hypothetical protein
MLFEETHVANIGLALCSSSRTDNDIDRLGRRQPDWILVSKQDKRIAIVDLGRPSDIHQAQLLAAAIRKQQAYQPLVDGLSYYTEQGWVVHVLPLIVGIRGMIDSFHVESLLKFLDIPRKYWHVAIEKIALASVQAFLFLHKVRFGGPLERVQLDMDLNGICNTSEDDISITTKRTHETTSKNLSGADSDSDSHEHVRLNKEIGQLQRPEHTSPEDPVLVADEVESSPLALTGNHHQADSQSRASHLCNPESGTQSTEKTTLYCEA